MWIQVRDLYRTLESLQSKLGQPCLRGARLVRRGTRSGPLVPGKGNCNAQVYKAHQSIHPSILYTAEGYQRSWSHSQLTLYCTRGRAQPRAGVQRHPICNYMLRKASRMAVTVRCTNFCPSNSVRRVDK